ncbi:MAG TPA: hypothetical protein PK667_02555 [Nitrosomonas europaea]|uniref:hypothetical protein n=1 Tax=Nitrosomonas europaea TaxID=915 RepID=UPI002490190F|nr:hypothetical protein [Nitrosomonas europaea]HRN83118.1 hypothetical protein [Nitrosomonas europaea]HRO55418.1 hypothetical protein [Nitrosomonas europaea]HUM73067.1 hypothetical protein [Nitrosomonas europaea]
MDETRRDFIKGMFAGGTCLALGVPGIAQATSMGSFLDSTRNCRLLLGNTIGAESFAKGVQSACFSHGSRHHGTLPVFRFESELSTGFLHLVDLLMQSRNTRWIAIMDHAYAAIFAELVRNSTARLLVSGAHTFVSGNHTALPLRHVWAAASPAYSAGELLASMLAHERYSFSIVERFLTQTAGESTENEALSLSEFLSYHRADQPATRLYCAGVSLPEAGRLLGWETSKNQESLFSRTITATASRDKTADSTTIKYPRSDNWVEATGYAIAAAALGMKINRESCSERAFVHRSSQHYLDHKGLPGVNFVSFVIDV